jgi:elongation factor P
MASINANDLKRGMAIRLKGDVCLIQETTHRTPGNLRAFVQVSMRSLSNGRMLEERLSSTEKVELVNVSTEKWEFSYKDPNGYNFINPETYDNLVLGEDTMGASRNYLTENLMCDLVFIEGRVAEVELPPTVNLKVIESPEGVKGDSATNVQKNAKLETGLMVQVPLFIKEGEILKIDTRTGKYLSRA